ncbi:class I SAM-dependent methyltransferase [Ruegeria sp. 6PALISEP08]|uniref:class I SAM-dependent methyltransferase n=1 Tax=Ruegeria sp. 6PALISEP08 TaxID=1225660 RepID=UPI00067F3E86|nr:class I SAM-dependent methyltransferase [Ruegeria sp. 6PALISEP08]
MSHSPLTGEKGEFLFEADVIGCHPARYFLDKSCGFIWVDSPTWLNEAYSDAIALTDTGILARNLNNIRGVSLAMRANGLAEARGIDIGGGYGLLVRGLRDIGLHFHWSDPFADNLVARGFEADNGSYSVATAFEVLEHLPNPLSQIKEARARFGFDTLFFSATCFDPNAIPSRDWWYWVFETGQHISFSSEQCLDFMASELGMRKVHLTGDIYVFTTLDKFAWPGKWHRRKLKKRFGHDSLTQVDYDEMKRRVTEQQQKP